MGASCIRGGSRGEPLEVRCPDRWPGAPLLLLWFSDLLKLNSNLLLYARPSIPAGLWF